MLISTLVLPALLGVAAAKKCFNQTVEVDISTRNGVFGNIVIPQTNIEVTNFTLRLSKQGHNFTNEGLTGYDTVSGTYSISTQYCVPDHPSKDKSPVLQILTHGIGFDKTYWDLSYDNFENSYVNNAVDKHGYHTLSYDRLGVGNSTHAKDSTGTRDEIQSFLEIAALKALTEKARDGTFPQVPHKYNKVVHVGHSFGSAQSYAFSAMYPHLTDGVVLTGFSMNASFVGYFVLGGNFMQAALQVPDRLGAYPRGYLINSNEEALETLFLLPGYYSPPLLQVGQQTGQPVTIGELLTLGSLPSSNAFAGPVLVFTGDSDVPYCGGDCLITGDPAQASIPAGVAKNFPAARGFEAYIQPHTGHGLTFHYNATAGYDVIASYLASNGLGAAEAAAAPSGAAGSGGKSSGWEGAGWGQGFSGKLPAGKEGFHWSA